VGDAVVVHTLEDTIKNLKHGLDSLASILCDYQYCNVSSAQKLVLTGHIINNKLTIIKYSPGRSSKWTAIEVKSCTISLQHEKRKETVKLYETSSYIYVSKTHTMYISSMILILHLF
jgi:hypothetical protein